MNQLFKTRVLLRAFLAAALFAAMPASVIAVNASPTASPSSSPAASARLTNLKAKGTAEIDRRIASLEAALEKLSESKHLSQANKDTLTKQTQDELTALKALKTQLAADTDLATARTHVVSIVSGYRVYALMLPKARMTASADRFAAAQAKLDELATKLQAEIDKAKSAGQDTTIMQANLDTMKAKIAASKSRTTGITDKLLALQPTEYNANRTVLVEYRTALRAAQTDLKAARDAAKSVIDALKAAK